MTGINILVVDDDHDMADGLVDIFDEFGFGSTGVYNGNDAFDAYTKTQFDIVFMDIKMPGMNGVECLAKIRAHDPNAKVVMMTGYSMETVLSQAIDEGAISVLRKPVEVERVLSEIKRILPHGIILLADDDPDFIQATRHLLADSGYAVHHATSGASAVEEVIGGQVDILILDLKMPAMSGLEVYLEIKRSKPPPPTIIVTAYVDELNPDIDHLRSMDVAGFLAKPFDPEELIEITRRLAADGSK